MNLGNLRKIANLRVAVDVNLLVLSVVLDAATAQTLRVQSFG